MWKIWIASERPFIPIKQLLETRVLIDEGGGPLTGRIWKVYGFEDGRGPCYRFYDNDEEAREVIWEEDK